MQNEQGESSPDKAQRDQQEGLANSNTTQPVRGKDEPDDKRVNPPNNADSVK